MAESTKDKIINSTYNLMLEADDISKITVRMIAAKADVNVALVNYYFFTKDNLFNEVINTILITSKQLFERLDNESVPTRERLFNFVINYQKHMLKHRKFIIYLFFNKQSFPTQLTFLQFLRTEGILKIQRCIMELLTNRSKSYQKETANTPDPVSESKFIFEHLISIMAFPVIYSASLNSALQVQEFKNALINHNQSGESIKYFFNTYFPEV